MTKDKLVSLTLKTSDVKINGNVRTTTDKRQDDELAKSVGRDGVLEPLLVRKVGKNYVLISGHRRLAAAKKVKATVPVRVMDVSEDEARGIQIVENLHRRDLTPLEEAEGFKDLIEANGTQPIWDHKGKKVLPSKLFIERAALVGKTIGKPGTYVVRTLRLLELPAKILNWIKKGKLTAQHGVLLIDLTEEGRDSVIKNFLEGRIEQLKPGDVFPVSSLKQEIDKKFNKVLSDAIFPIDSEYVGEVACTACPMNSGNSMELFGGAKIGNCRDGACFNRKVNGFWRNEKLALEKKVPVVTDKDNKKTPIKFIGYSRLTADWNGKISWPDIVKGNQILKPSKVLNDLVKAKPGAIGWTLIKPTTDKKGRVGTIGYVVMDPAAVRKAGIKVKVNVIPHESTTDYELETHVRKGVANEVNIQLDKKLRALKPSNSWLYVVAEELLMDDTQGLKETCAEILGVKLKFKKGTNALEGLSLSMLGLLWLATEARHNPELVGIYRDSIMKQLRPGLVDEYKQKLNAKQEKESK